MLMYSQQLPIGWQAPDFKLPDTGGNIYDFSQVAPKHGILVIFICNHCPYAKAAWPTLCNLAAKYQKRGFDFIAINPNNSKDYPDDDLEGMIKKVHDTGMTFPYLRDETGEIAKKYQVQCTPDIYLLNKEKKLYYHGRINDNWKEPATAARNDLDDALRRLFIGDRPPVEQFPSMGCSIKW